MGNGTEIPAGGALFGLTFSSNIEGDYVVVLNDENGDPVAGVTVTPTPVILYEGALVGTVDLVLPAGIPPGNYYLQVRAAGGSGYSHTVDPIVEDLTVDIEPTAGSEPGTYPAGTWITLDAVAAGGTPFDDGYRYNWMLNGAPDMGTAAQFSFQIAAATNYSVSVRATDSLGAEATSAPLDYRGA